VLLQVQAGNAHLGCSGAGGLPYEETVPPCALTPVSAQGWGAVSAGQFLSTGGWVSISQTTLLSGIFDGC
jgi:hypothetical protein